ncbi:hypothetical protein C8J57DRAFT_1336146, partial [Mycena rebaudengoi]
MTETWLDLGLSSQLLAISTATEELKNILRKAGVEVGKNELKDLESKISSLRKTLSTSNPDPSDNNPAIHKLAKDVKDTLWDRVPLRAVAKAHKDAGDELFDRGNVDPDSTEHLSAVYREYAKYLLLHPERDDAKYIETFKKIRDFQDALERAGNSTLNVPKGDHVRLKPHPPPSGPTETKKFRWSFRKSSRTNQK